MSERRAVTKTIALRYARVDRAGKKIIVNELCAMTGWHRDHAWKVLRRALAFKELRPHPSRSPSGWQWAMEYPSGLSISLP